MEIRNFSFSALLRQLSLSFLLAALAAVSLRHREVRDPLSELVARVRARLELESACGNCAWMRARVGRACYTNA